MALERQIVKAESGLRRIGKGSTLGQIEELRDEQRQNVKSGPDLPTQKICREARKALDRRAASIQR